MTICLGGVGHTDRRGYAPLAENEKKETDARRAAGEHRPGGIDPPAAAHLIRNTGKARFQHTDRTLCNWFMAIPDQMARIDAACALVLAPDTWEPISELTPTVYKAQIATVQVQIVRQTKEGAEASAASPRRKQVAVKTHDRNVQWFAVVSNSHPKDSPRWDIMRRTITHEHATGATPQPPAEE